MSFIEIFIFVAAYLVGSVPSGYLIAKWHGIADIRKYGSGNIGATNVARILGMKYFFIVFLLDCSKTFLYLTVLYHIGFGQYVLFGSAIALLIGNGGSIFLGFRGGKGISTGVGILLALHPQLFFATFITWVLVVWITRIVGMASVLSLLLLPIFSHFLFHDSSVMVQLALFMAAWSLFLHRNNIKSYISQ